MSEDCMRYSIFVWCFTDTFLGLFILPVLFYSLLPLCNKHRRARFPGKIAHAGALSWSLCSLYFHVICEAFMVIRNGMMYGWTLFFALCNVSAWG